MISSIYFQIISEAEIIDDPIMLFKEFFMRVFTRSRKLAPVRVKPAPVKIEKTEKMSVFIAAILIVTLIFNILNWLMNIL